MASATEESVIAAPTAYKELAELEMEFDIADTELLKHQIRLFTPLYERRAAVLANIPHFWRIIFETAGAELDEHIHAEDWAFLGTHLKELHVERPFPDTAPRTFDVVLRFAPDNGWLAPGKNELRKRFEFKSLRAGDEQWTGLVSEPVLIEWADEKKDLTGGIGRLAKEVFDARKKRALERFAKGVNGGEKTDEERKPDPREMELEEKVAQGVSFFVWFSWIGEYFMVLEQEHAAEKKKGEKGEKEAKAPEAADKARENADAEDDSDADDNDGDDDDDDDDPMVDVFPDGEKLAYLLSEDLFPNALKHYTDAMENEEGMDVDELSEGEGSIDDQSIDLGSDEEAAEAAIKKSKKRVKEEDGAKKSKKAKTSA